MGIPDELYEVEISGLRKEHLYRTVKLRGLVRKATPVRPRMEIGNFDCVWERHRNSFMFVIQPYNKVTAGFKNSINFITTFTFAPTIAIFIIF